MCFGNKEMNPIVLLRWHLFGKTIPERSEYLCAFAYTFRTCGSLTMFETLLFDPRDESQVGGYRTTYFDDNLSPGKSFSPLSLPLLSTSVT